MQVHHARLGRRRAHLRPPRRRPRLPARRLCLRPPHPPPVGRATTGRRRQTRVRPRPPRAAATRAGVGGGDPRPSRARLPARVQDLCGAGAAAGRVAVCVGGGDPLVRMHVLARVGAARNTGLAHVAVDGGATRAVAHVAHVGTLRARLRPCAADGARAGRRGGDARGGLPRPAGAPLWHRLARLLHVDDGLPRDHAQPVVAPRSREDLRRRDLLQARQPRPRAAGTRQVAPRVRAARPQARV
mmetsp:Transcript_8069/g.21173  ORF Transcript_8069/g.21173 Transcript_8069/m.21173 type:complete len:243 (+) Transcript_8069:1078-1806(+)